MAFSTFLRNPMPTQAEVEQGVPIVSSVTGDTQLQ